jgi:predicted HTH domain antitoxin
LLSHDSFSSQAQLLDLELRRCAELIRKTALAWRQYTAEQLRKERAITVGAC